MNQKLITQLFGHLDEHFETWKKYVGNKSVERQYEWLNELDGLTGKDLRQGLDSAFTHKAPPTLEQFKRMCTAANSAARVFQGHNKTPKACATLQQNEVEKMRERLRA